MKSVNFLYPAIVLNLPHEIQIIHPKSIESIILSPWSIGMFIHMRLLSFQLINMLQFFRKWKVSLIYKWFFFSLNLKIFVFNITNALQFHFKYKTKAISYFLFIFGSLSQSVFGFWERIVCIVSTDLTV